MNGQNGCGVTIWLLPAPIRTHAATAGGLIGIVAVPVDPSSAN
jgi:hypothetical protein